MFKKKSSGSVQPRKQRALQSNTPRHRWTLLNAHLSKDLRSKLKRRSLRVRKGDTVRVLRGTYQGKEGIVESVLVKRGALIITGVERSKRGGSKVHIPVRASRVLLISLKDDARRFGNVS